MPVEIELLEHFALCLLGAIDLLRSHCIFRVYSKRAGTVRHGKSLRYQVYDWTGMCSKC